MGTTAIQISPVTIIEAAMIARAVRILATLSLIPKGIMNVVLVLIEFSD